MPRYMILQLLLLCGYLLVIGHSWSVSRFDNNHDDIYIGHKYKKPFTLKEIYLRMFYAEHFNGTWISDTEIIIPDIVSGDVTIYNVETRKTEEIFVEKDLSASFTFNTVVLSFDRQYILFGYNSSRVFRHSTIMNYKIFDVNRRKYINVADGAALSLAIWSPTSNDLAYVQDNDIYYMSLENGQVKSRKVTNTGIPGIIYNGIPDWVYEEEVFSSGIAMRYSPNGQYLLFASFNDTVVKDMAYFHYGVPGSLEDQYPTQVKIKYPKVGTPNPIVSLSVIDLTDPSSKAISLKAPISKVDSEDHILATINWWQTSQVIATWMNRVQNESYVIVYDMKGNGNLILSNRETEGWLQPNHPIKVGNQALMLQLQDSGTSAGRFRHITRYNYEKNERFVSPVDLTPGPSEVLSIVGIDFLKKLVYYLATAPGKPNQRNLYSVPLNGSQKPTCISCGLLTPEGNECTYVSAFFSKLKSYYTLTCFGPDPITVGIYNDTHHLVLNWTNNMGLRNMLSERLMPQQRNFNITVNNYDSRVRLLLPPDFNENESYPLLVHVYAGPNSVRITDVFKPDYEFYLTTNKRIVYAWIDGRGSAYKGSNMLFEIYRRLGTVEIEDTIAVTKALRKQYKWIDPDRIGIWGWSYGGFTTGMTLATDIDSVFKCGISVAPVTSWIYYDSIYTERYMGLPTPEDNLAGYNRTDIMRKADGIRNKKFMLIHGTGDDNVHYQQAMALAKTLENRDILFEQITYTDEAHALEHVWPHFYHTMDKFWNECFELKPNSLTRRTRRGSVHSHVNARDCRDTENAS